MKTGVLLAGCGVFDGSEIQEAVFSLLAIEEAGHEPVCIAPDIEQYHVVNHITGEEMKESRNVLIESARIARGNISDINNIKAANIDALMIPGGFGAAKNLNKWALEGPDGAVHPKVKGLILEMAEAGKPIGAVCMGPTVIAKALEGSPVKATLTIGTTEKPSPYDIAGIAAGIEKTGMKHEMKTVEEISVDQTNKIVTGPCYNMEANVPQIRKNVKMVVDQLAAF